MAERVGFEPTVETSPTPVFETGPFNHSGISPDAAYRVYPKPGKVPRTLQTDFSQFVRDVFALLMSTARSSD
jgi:hypothetical protein